MKLSRAPKVPDAPKKKLYHSTASVRRRRGLLMRKLPMAREPFLRRCSDPFSNRETNTLASGLRTTESVERLKGWLAENGGAEERG